MNIKGDKKAIEKKEVTYSKADKLWFFPPKNLSQMGFHMQPGPSTNSD